MYVYEINFESIVERKIFYIKTSKMYAGSEMEHIKKGELRAYDFILSKIKNLDEKNFTEVMLKAFKEVQCYFEQEHMGELQQNEIEELVGYNNAIVFVLTLLNPRYEFSIHIDEKGEIAL